MTSHSDPLPPPVFDHVMIDIETMSLSKTNALILSIGMIEFDPTRYEGLVIGAKCRILPSIEQQLMLGREVSAGTQKFWRDQPTEASAHWLTNTKGDRAPLGATCGLVQMFCERASRVWANGTQFDLSNLEGLNAQLDVSDRQKELWHYQKPRDMRTFCRETPATRLLPIGDAFDIPGVPHEPLYDCIVQAHQVWSHWSNG